MATAKNICPREDGLDNLGRKEKAWGNVYTKNLHVTGSVELPADFVNGILAKKLLPKVTITTLSGSTVTATNGTSALNSTEAGSTGEFSFEIPSLGKWTFTATKTGSKAFTRSVTVDVEEIKEYKVEIAHGVRYGYRVKKDEGNPYGRVEYLFDAVGFTPAKMNFTTGAFDYGSWKDKWFVTKNKPCMVKSNGQIDYYLNPNNYALKENGTASDVANVNYDGNAMAQIPLVWVSRYERDGYEYEIISDIQYDDTYKAYAHTRADGTIADYFLYSMFGGSGGTAKMRSLSGQSLAHDLTAEQEIAGCKANGDGWFIHTWSQRQLIRTLLVLMGKSTDTQAVFGIGNCRGGSNAGSLLATGTLIAKGQFWGTNANSSSQVKVFHIEKFWGDQWDRTAGLIYNNGNICVKMTPEGNGYRLNDIIGYTNTGVNITGSSGGYINKGTCTEYGFIPNTVSGSSTTYYGDGCWFNGGGLRCALCGEGAGDASGIGGAFALFVADEPSWAGWDVGCGLSLLPPAA